MTTTQSLSPTTASGIARVLKRHHLNTVPDYRREGIVVRAGRTGQVSVSVTIDRPSLAARNAAAAREVLTAAGYALQEDSVGVGFTVLGRIVS